MTELWQIQPIDARTPSLDDIHRIASAVHRAVERRNRFGLLIAVAEIFAFSGMWLAFPNPIQRIGCAWTVAGLLYMSGQLLKRPASKPDASLGMSACVDFQRVELARQRDFHRGWWFWSRFVAFVPGPAIYGIGAIMAFPDRAVSIVAIGIVYVAIALWAVPLNLRLARAYQRRIDQLTDTV